MSKKLKPVPKGNKGLSKLPTKVRNKMGFLKKGGPVNGSLKSLKKSPMARKKMGFQSQSGKMISDADRAKPFKGKIDTDTEKLVSENGKTMVVQKAKGGSIQVSGNNFSGVY